MKVLRVFLALVIATVCLVSLPTCTRLLYYLEQVYKVHGTVTVDGTDPPTPLGSVEVSMGDYRYSELTNYYGDYELEMAEGIWTIKFQKDGFETVSVEVELGPDNPSLPLDVAMVLDVPSGPISLTGIWNFWMEENGEAGPYLLYFEQDGTNITGMYGITGTLFGTDLEFQLVEPGSDDEEEIITMYFSGQVTGDEVVGTWTTDEEPPPPPEPPPPAKPWHMVRLDYTFGTLALNGTVDLVPVDIDSDQALGVRGPVYNARVIHFNVDHPWYHTVEIRSWGQDLAASTDPYQVGHFSLYEDETGCEIVMWGSDPAPANAFGMLTITDYQVGNRIAGWFVDEFGGTTTFFNITVSDGGTWGTYNASNVQDYTTAYSEVAVIYLDTETEFILSFGNAQHLSAGYIYTAFASGRTLLAHGLRAEFGWESEALGLTAVPISGQVMFNSFNATGMAGSVDVDLVDMDSNESVGSLSGTFNVPFELEDY